jgi:hypothetical protein
VTAVDVDPLVGDPEVRDVPPDVAHIVRVERGEDAAAKVLEARVTGSPVEALCGHVWVPSKDPKRLPLCEPCREVYEMYRSFNPDGVSRNPSELPT